MTRLAVGRDAAGASLVCDARAEPLAVDAARPQSQPVDAERLRARAIADDEGARVRVARLWMRGDVLRERRHGERDAVALRVAGDVGLVDRDRRDAEVVGRTQRLPAEHERRREVHDVGHEVAQDRLEAARRGRTLSRTSGYGQRHASAAAQHRRRAAVSRPAAGGARGDDEHLVPACPRGGAAPADRVGHTVHVEQGGFGHQDDSHASRSGLRRGPGRAKPARVHRDVRASFTGGRYTGHRGRPDRRAGRVAVAVSGACSRWWSATRSWSCCRARPSWSRSARWPGRPARRSSALLIPVAAVGAVVGRLPVLPDRTPGRHRPLGAGSAAPRIAPALARTRATVLKRPAVLIFTARYIPFARIAVNLSAGRLGTAAGAGSCRCRPPREPAGRSTTPASGCCSARRCPSSRCWRSPCRSSSRSRSACGRLRPCTGSLRAEAAHRAEPGRQRERVAHPGRAVGLAHEVGELAARAVDALGQARLSSSPSRSTPRTRRSARAPRAGR